jgi:hypothetical protein
MPASKSCTQKLTQALRIGLLPQVREAREAVAKAQALADANAAVQASAPTLKENLSIKLQAAKEQLSAAREDVLSTAAAAEETVTTLKATTEHLRLATDVLAAVKPNHHAKQVRFGPLVGRSSGQVACRPGPRTDGAVSVVTFQAIRMEAEKQLLMVDQIMEKAPYATTEYWGQKCHKDASKEVVRAGQEEKDATTFLADTKVALVKAVEAAEEVVMAEKFLREPKDPLVLLPEPEEDAWMAEFPEAEEPPLEEYPEEEGDDKLRPPMLQKKQLDWQKTGLSERKAAREVALEEAREIQEQDKLKRVKERERQVKEDELSRWADARAAAEATKTQRADTKSSLEKQLDWAKTRKAKSIKDKAIAKMGFLVAEFLLHNPPKRVNKEAVKQIVVDMNRDIGTAKTNVEGTKRKTDKMRATLEMVEAEAAEAITPIEKRQAVKQAMADKKHAAAAAAETIAETKRAREKKLQQASLLSTSHLLKAF